jgi:hypothetical protein
MTTCSHGLENGGAESCPECVSQRKNNEELSIDPWLRSGRDEPPWLRGPRARRCARIGTGVIAVGVVIAVVVAITGSPSGSAGAAALMRVAATNSMSSPSLHVTLSGDELVRYASHTLNLRFDGSGIVDSRSDDAELSMRFVEVDHSFNFNFRERVVNDVVYTQDSAVPVPNGATWIGQSFNAFTRTTSSSSTDSTISPDALFAMLRAEGAQVDPKGSIKIDGIVSRRYRVTLSRRVLIQQEAKLSLTPFIRQQVRDSLAQTPSISYTVDVNDAQHMIDRIVVRLPISAGTGVRAAITLSETFTSYGPAISIIAPPRRSVYFEGTGTSVTSNSPPITTTMHYQTIHQ